LTRKVLTALRRTFNHPLDRGDIKDLITSMDDAIDQMNQTASGAGSPSKPEEFLCGTESSFVELRRGFAASQTSSTCRVMNRIPGPSVIWWG